MIESIAGIQRHGPQRPSSLPHRRPASSSGRATGGEAVKGSGSGSLGTISDRRRDGGRRRTKRILGRMRALSSIPFKQIIFQNVEGAEAQIAALKRGDIDLTRELPPRTVATLTSYLETNAHG